MSTTFSTRILRGAKRAVNVALASSLFLFLTGSPSLAIVGGISFRAASFNNTGGVANSLVIAKPSGLQVDDVMVAQISVRGGASAVLSPPSGWTMIRSDNTGVGSPNLLQVLYYRVADASDGSATDYTWDITDASHHASGGILAYLDVDTTNPINAEDGQANASGMSVTAPSITTTVDGAQILGFFGTAYQSSFTADGSMAEQYDTASNDTTSGTTSEGADESQGTQGATGTRTATAANAAVNIGQLVALTPACVNGCLVSGTCYADGDPNPANQCEVCDVGTSTTSFTAKANDTPCDADSDGCTVDDSCQSGTCTAGSAANCDDGLACTGPDTCTSTGSNSYTCDNSTITAGTCAIAGTCYNNGDPNPSNECEQCTSGTSQTSFSPKADSTPCNADSNGCTADDSCQSGTCTAGSAPDCSDGLTCTSDTCVTTGDNSHTCDNSTIIAGQCLIAGTCYTSGALNPGNQCQACIPGTDQTAFSDRPDNTPCNADSDGCTQDDSCQTGTCTAGSSPSCDDGLSCTGPDTCVSTGDNSHSCDNGTIAGGSCFINGVCYADGDPNPNDACEKCVSGTSQTAFTFADGDGDGVCDAIEDAAPNGDGNGDGTMDSQQPNVASLPCASGPGYCTVVTSGAGGCGSLLNVHTMVPGNDPDYAYPFGLVGFELNCASSASIKVIYSAGTAIPPGVVYRKFGKVAPNFAGPNLYYTLPGVTFALEQIPPSTGPILLTASFVLTDNLLGDSSGTIGLIVDPSGPGVFAQAAAPVLSPWGLLALVVLMTGLGALLVARRRLAPTK